MARPSHRPVNQRDNYRPGAEESDRGYERRGRSKSRERRRSPPLPRGRTDSWRSPAEIRDHDRTAPSRRERERSTESRRSGRPHSPSPHRSSRIEKDRVRSPDMGDSRHSRHSHRRRSPTPPAKRRRSTSPYPSAKKPSKKSKRPRSPPPRPGSPSRRGRPRDPSLSPRRALSPRTRKMDIRPPTRGSERSRSPASHVRRRSLSPRSPRHQRQSSTTRRSPPPSHHRPSPRPPSRRYSPSSRRSPETRRRTPPPRKRREPPGLSPRNRSPTSPKRRRISRSPRADVSPQAFDTLSKDRKSDRDNIPNSSRRNEKESTSDVTRKETSLRYSKTSSPVRSKSPAGNSQNSINRPTAENPKTRTPPQPIPSFEGHTDDPRNTDNHETNEYDSKSDVSRPGHESERHSESPSSSDYRPPPHFNPDRAARIREKFKPKGWNEVSTAPMAMSEPLYTRKKTSQPYGFNGTSNISQGQGHGSAPFYQQQNSQSQYGSNTQMHGQYQQSYRNVNQPGGFRPNQFTPVVEQGPRAPTQHGFQIQAPPSQPRGRPINVFVGNSGRLNARGGYGSIKHTLPPPPPPASLLPPAPEAADSPTDPDDNPYRPATFRVRDELEEEEQEPAKATPTKPQAPRSAPQQPAAMAPPTEPKQMQQASDSAHMPPPQQGRPNATPSKRRTPTHPASENSKSFRPFSLSLTTKSRNPSRNEPSARLKSLTAREKATEPTSLPSAGAEATSQVVEALKAISGPSQMAPPPLQTPAPQTPVTPSPQNPNDPHRFSVYERVTMVGEGTYGKVYKAKNKNTNELVALKRIRMESERDGFPITAVREMKLLQSLKHVNIVSLLETMVERVPTKTHSDFYMVFEYMDHDLTGILNHPTLQLEPGHIKHLAQQFFEGLQYLHHRGVLHRDIKASNILLDSNGLLKLADFGLARFYQKRKKGLDYTNRIITLWYRPPEILLGDTAYGPAVDIWSAGCVFAELFTRVAVFPGSTEINQLDVIYDLLGTPTKEDWPMLTKMPWYELLKPPTRKQPKFDEKYKGLLPPAALELVKWIFSFDPDKRPTAEQVLQHAYFTSEEPKAKPCSLAHLKGDWHEFEAKSRKRKERQAAKEREAQATRREASSMGSGGPSAESRQR